MTQDVVRVRRDASFKGVARALAEHDVSAVPVVDDLGHPLGVVPEPICCTGWSAAPTRGAAPAARLRPR